METETVNTVNGSTPAPVPATLLRPDVTEKLINLFAERQPKLFGEYLSEILTGVKVTRGGR